MGGWGSGRSGGRPVKEEAKTVDLAMMMRKNWIGEGRSGGGTLSWSVGDRPAGSISYRCDMIDPDNASLTLSYRQQRHGEDWVSREQSIRLVYTQPHYGGRRWWMLCPVRHERVGKLYLPNGGDIFAGRKAWRLGYRSQRVAGHDKVFERLFALQRKLGCNEGWEAGIRRPKGMWQRTYERHWERYWELDRQCGAEMAGFVLRLGRR